MKRLRVKTTEGHVFGRIHDVYFDDETWRVRHIVVALEPRQFGQRHVLIDPSVVLGLNSDGFFETNLPAQGILDLPLASSVLPVCRQYAALSYSSPRPGSLPSRGLAADPHLRSASAVLNYTVEFAGAFSGLLADLLLDSEAWVLRYLALEQTFEKKKLQLFVVPQTVDRFTWSTQRVLLRELQPVAVDAAEIAAEFPDRDVA